MLILGLLLLAGAAAVGVTGILSNRGGGHQVAGGFHAFGHTMHGSSGQLFFWGIVVGGVAMLGLMLLLAGIRGGFKRRGTARRSAGQARTSRREAVVSDDTADVDETRADETRAAARTAAPEPEKESALGE